MSTVMLLHTLKAFVEQHVANVQLGKDRLPPNVYIGFVPIKDVPERPTNPPIGRTTPSEIPYIIIRLMQGEAEQNLGSANVGMLFSAYDETEQGYLDVLNVMEVVKQAILTTIVLDGKYELDETDSKKMKWLLHDEAYPNHFGEIHTNWTYKEVERVLTFND